MAKEKTEYIVDGNVLTIKKEEKTFEVRFNTNDELGYFLLKILMKNDFFA